MTMLERSYKFEPAYDKRNDPKGNFGMDCVTLRMLLKGPLGEVQFVLHTGWYLHTQEAPKMHCECMEQGRHHLDFFRLNADRIFCALVHEGDEGMWRELEDYYHRIFDSKLETEVIA